MPRLPLVAHNAPVMQAGFIFPKIYFTCNLTHFEGENFSDSSFHQIFESENFRLPFFQAWGEQCEKFNFRKW